jgi:hypothetical protein
MIYLRAKFHLPTSNGSLIIAIRPKAKAKFRMAAKLLF